ncbi:hypothetical protein BV20DRAFT_1054376 [Pilatotrama ljubarskyi]|nr:hypothetical protein BV20DRAFT_1054376 [Pilatotrama ljubarskyi]
MANELEPFRGKYYIIVTQIVNAIGNKFECCVYTNSGGGYHYDNANRSSYNKYPGGSAYYENSRSYERLISRDSKVYEKGRDRKWVYTGQQLSAQP